MTTRPISASDIRQAVIGFPLKVEMCGMIAVQAQIIWGANLIPSGPRAAVTIHAASRRVRACRPIVYGFKGSDDGTPTTPRRRALGDVASCWAAAVRFGNFGEMSSTKKPATDFSVRASTIFRDDAILPVICPTCQTIFEPLPNCIKCAGMVSTN